MFLDHYVAKNHTSLKIHVDYVYKSANDYSTLLPSSFNNMLQFMEQYNWLQTYVSLEGLKNIMLQMRQRIGNKAPLDEAVNIMVRKEEEFNYLFKQIWQDAQTKYLFE
jgi:acyl carrier protein phosphodiesterase